MEDFEILNEMDCSLPPHIQIQLHALLHPNRRTPLNLFHLGLPQRKIEQRVDEMINPRIYHEPAWKRLLRHLPHWFRN